MSRAACLGLALLVILAGVALRLGPWRLPLAVHHDGGGVLWGMMLYLIAAALRPAWAGRSMIVAAAGLTAAAIEFVRLIHFPGLDAFRGTLAGQLLLGRLFSPWNLLAYAAGIGAMAMLVRPVVRPGRAIGRIRQASLDSAPAPSDPSSRRSPVDGRWRA